MPLLDFGAEAIYKHNDYKDTILGRTKDQRQELYLSASYGDMKVFRVIVFGDIEFTQYDSLHRVGSGDPNPEAPPSGGPPNTTYNWSAENKDRSWQVGIGAEWVPTDQWTEVFAHLGQDPRQRRLYDAGWNRTRRPVAADQQLRQHDEDVLQSERHVQPQQELGVYRRLRV